MAETFSYIPTESGTSRTETPRVKEISFGNGYVQTYGDGINSVTEEWQLTFEEHGADVATILALFRSNAGFNYFNWTSPIPGAVEKQYRCTTWSVSGLGADYYQITATFKEWHGLV